MSTTTTNANLTRGRESGTTGAGMPASAELDVGERQILVRVDRGMRIGEGELRYQLERKDAHPLARAGELLDVLADLESRGLLDAELCFRLTTAGRGLLDGGGG